MSNSQGWHKMELASAIVNRPIIDVLHGSQIGIVHDIYVDAQLSQITAFFIGHDNTPQRNAGIVERRDVTLFGGDVILVKHSNVAVVANNVVQFPRLAGWIRCGDLLGRAVSTLEGTLAGNLVDLVLDRAEMSLLGLALGQETAEGGRNWYPISINAVRALTYDSRIVIDITAAERDPIAFRRRAMPPTSSGSSLN